MTGKIIATSSRSLRNSRKRRQRLRHLCLLLLRTETIEGTVEILATGFQNVRSHRPGLRLHLCLKLKIETTA